ncbi:MAG: S8 family serine peptidase [Proteobacteria bacterium]|nr:S8 family serine peptidase [Pseudomonadota bacterium]
MNRIAAWAAALTAANRALLRRSPAGNGRGTRTLIAAFAAIVAATPVLAIDANLSPNVVSQIQTLQAEKASRTPAERKVDSQLLYASRVATHNVAMYGGVALDTGIAPDANGMVRVEIRAPVTDATLNLVKAAGGVVLASFPTAESIQANVPIASVVSIAADPSVRFVRPPSRPQINNAVKVVANDAAPASTQQPLSPRLQRFKTTLQQALAAKGITDCCGAGPVVNSGSVNSQGDYAHRAQNARAAFGVDGTGIRIGVLSDSFNNLGGADDDVINGDLPGPGNPNGYTTPVTLIGSGDCLQSFCADEGRAMLQIVHDLAPGATLYFATAFNSDVDFANNIRALAGLSVTAPPDGIATPGCDIIIDDVSYSNESGLHDGQPAPSDASLALITQAVNDVTAAGVLYFSSAANSGNKYFGTSGTWEGDYVGGTLPTVLSSAGASALIWSGTAVTNALTVATNDVTMQWSDPINGSCNDYDLYRLNAAESSILTASTNTQDCTQDPYEELYTGANFAVGSKLVVVLAAGSPRFISLSTQRGQLTYNTTGATRGHNAAKSGFSVAATPAATPYSAPTPQGPYPGPFVSTNTVETFSSDGPRRSFFDADGNAYTPGDFSSTGGVLNQKPDFTAADGVNTTLPPSTGLNPFYGTSAAAPHAGAIAALVKQKAPSATPDQLRTYLMSTTLDIMTPGFDAPSGFGILQAFQAVSAAAGGVGVPTFDPGTISATRLPIAGPILPGDSASMTVQIINNGAVTATNVSAVLTTSTPCITVTSGSSAYPDAAVGASATNTTAFTFALSDSCICPVTIDFTLTVTFDGGSSVINFSYVTGPPPVVINGDLVATPTVPGGYSYSHGTQSTRLFRNAAGPTCEAPQAYPGTSGGTATRRYDAYTFTTGSESTSYCVAVDLKFPGFGTTAQLQSGAYVGGPFVPSSLGTNYAADSAASSTDQSYSFTVPANTSVTITVNEVTAGSGSLPYTITIGGMCGVNGDAPGVSALASRMVHGGAGTFDLALNNVPTNPTTEPRAGSAHTVVFTFSKPIASATATVTEGTATAGTLVMSGNEVQVPLTGVTDQQYVTVQLSDIVATDSGTSAPVSVRMGLLAGNVKQTRLVTYADLLTISPQIAQTVTSANFLLDVNVDGLLSVTDLLTAAPNVTKALPAP